MRTSWSTRTSKTASGARPCSSVPGSTSFRLTNCSIEAGWASPRGCQGGACPRGKRRCIYWCHRRRANFCWLVEDDVAWDSPATLSGVVTAFERDTSGLVGHRMANRTTNPAWNHWNACRDALPFSASEPSIGAFLPLSRVSLALLDSLDTFAAEHGRLCYLEVLLPALANAAGLGVSYMNKGDGPLPRRRRGGEAWGPTRLSFRFRPPYSTAEFAAMQGPRVIHPVKSPSWSLVPEVGSINGAAPTGILARLPGDAGLTTGDLEFMPDRSHTVEPATA